MIGRERLTGSIVEGIEHGKQSADDENVGILIESHFDLTRECIKRMVFDVVDLWLDGSLISAAYQDKTKKSKGNEKNGKRDRDILYVLHAS